MSSGLNRAAQYRAAQTNDKRYDGIFFVATKPTGAYCRPSCVVPSPSQKDCSFFDTVEEALLQDYHACTLCHPDRLKNNLSSEILSNIDAGMISEKGVHGLADSLHISERHLRRIVQERTGTSPLHLSHAKRIGAARSLVILTKLPIIDIAFISDFSSLRQFNDAFRDAFNASPREVRKTASSAPSVWADGSTTIAPLKLSYAALLRVPLKLSIK